MMAKWWEKYLSKRSLIKHTCSLRDKLIDYLTPLLQNLIRLVLEKYLSKRSLIKHAFSWRDKLIVLSYATYFET